MKMISKRGETPSMLKIKKYYYIFPFPSACPEWFKRMLREE
jgi:hypothetical protein